VHARGMGTVSRFGWVQCSRGSRACPKASPLSTPTSALATPTLLTTAQVRLLSSLRPCSHVCENVLVAIRILAALPSGRRALRAAGAEAAVLAAASAAARPTTRRAVGTAAAAAAAAAGAIQERARRALQALTSPPGARLQESPCLAVSMRAAAPPKCVACGATEPPGGGPLLKCSGCGGPERWCNKECQRASWKAGHREVCKARRGGGGC
jgi:hypothetical protein